MATATIHTAHGKPIPPIRGTYAGGPYIDLHFGDGPAFDVINVWDYAAGKPTIENTENAVWDALVEWLDAMGDDLAHDLAAYAESIR